MDTTMAHYNEHGSCSCPWSSLDPFSLQLFNSPSLSQLPQTTSPLVTITTVGVVICGLHLVNSFFKLFLTRPLVHLHDCHHEPFWGPQTVSLVVVFTWSNKISTPSILHIKYSSRHTPWFMTRTTTHLGAHGLHLITIIFCFFLHFSTQATICLHIQ